MIFETLTQISNAELAPLFTDFEKVMHSKTFKKGDILHREGTVCNDIYFVEKGILRTFYFKDGKDITAHFALENGTTTAIDSFIQRKRSRYTIEVLEDTEAITISHADLHQLLEEKPQHEKYVRIFLEQIYIDLAERIEDLLFHSAKERYSKLITRSPDLLQRVNLSHIASFIGITQETLSRIRAQKV